jgi:hypothetical protein
MASASYPLPATNACGAGQSACRRSCNPPFPDRQVEGKWSFMSISQTVKLTDEPTPRANKLFDEFPFSARCRDLGASHGAVDAVVAAILHDPGQCDGHCLSDPGFAPLPESPIDRVPIAIFGQNTALGRTTAKPPDYAVDDGAVTFRPPARPGAMPQPTATP